VNSAACLALYFESVDKAIPRDGAATMQIATAWLGATALIDTSFAAAALVAFITIGFALGWIAAGYESGEF
jgi:hypothetical protein